MTKAELIKSAMAKTGQLLNPKVDTESLYISALQRLCQEQRWPWRKKYATFPSIIGTATYDLTAAANGGSTDLEEIKSMYRLDSSTSTPEVFYVDDDCVYVSARQSATAGDADTFTLELGTAQTVRLLTIPASVKTYAYIYWAIPLPSDATPTIPLLPAIYHWVLQRGLEMDIWQTLPGEGVESPNFQKAVAMYQQGVDLMRAKAKFSVKKQRSFASTENAVRSS